MRKPKSIDRIDLKILAALQSDGRMSNLELATKVGLSLSPCHQRHRALERAVQGYRARHRSCQLVDHVEILSFVTLHKHGRQQQGAFERLIDATRRPSPLDLRKLDYIVHCLCRSVRRLRRVHHSLIEEENIASVTTNDHVGDQALFRLSLEGTGRDGRAAEGEAFTREAVSRAYIHPHLALPARGSTVCVITLPRWGREERSEVAVRHPTVTREKEGPSSPGFSASKHYALTPRGNARRFSREAGEVGFHLSPWERSRASFARG
jgi:DNA-binding Lrp family transcriptional regulator